MMASRTTKWVGGLIVLAFTACAGDETPNADSAFAVEVTVSGLEGSGLVLQNNGGDGLAVREDGTAVFATKMEEGSTYEITVLAHPLSPAQTCTVTGGAGVISGASATGIAVDCARGTYSVGVTVSGLVGSGLVLQNNGGDNLTITENGSATFAALLEDSAAYSVSVLSQPTSPEQQCSVIGGIGYVTGANATGPEVECVTGLSATASPLLPYFHVSDTITISFSDSVDPGSLVLGGSMAVLDDGGVWSQTTAENDTLTISPWATWNAGAGETLTVNANDLHGNAMTQLTLSYDIYDCAFYFVSSTAVDDSGDGATPETAKQTIKAAIDAALSTPACVFVETGTYLVNSDRTGTPTHVVLAEGVSLYGGFSAGFSARDAGLYETLIEDISTERPNESNKSSAIFASGSAITNDTIVDGFTVRGTTSKWPTAILVKSGAAPTIQNNVIDGGYGDYFVAFGVYSIDSDPLIVGNHIDGGRGWVCKGLSFEGGNPIVTGNIIVGTTSATERGVGIYTSDAANLIARYNTIDGGASKDTKAIEMFNGSTGTLEHNDIYAGASTSSTPAAVRLSDMTGPLASVLFRDNRIHGGSGPSAMAVDSYNTNATFAGNTIYGGDGTAESTAVHAYQGNLVLVNNLLSAGSAASTRAMHIRNQALIVARNNTIYSGQGTAAVAVEVEDTAAATLDNNLLFGPSASTCIYNHADGTLESVRNNSLFGCSVLYNDDASGSGHGGECTGNGDGDNDSATCTLAEMEATTLGAGGASGNVSVDASFADVDGADNDILTLDDNDWHLSGTSPAEITAGGLNGVDEAWGYDDDRDGDSRPGAGTPWAIGAYEP